MHLMNSQTFRLEEFTENRIPPYAILSHTWVADEVTFKDIMEGTAEDKAGYQKIRYCGNQAAADNLRYFWADTCCIDKSNSSELSEAINSMFRWYKRATKCYVFLSDVDTQGSTNLGFIRQEGSSFRASRWFTRGWTLPELLAPADVEFYSRDWRQLGTKATLEQLICEITGIDIKALRGEPLWQFSVAQRMSWAARRRTTRTEDIAYSLMGVFDINMPLTYGEGEKAFMRLQEEIIKTVADQSIFAWAGTPSTDDISGPLAQSPAQFADSGRFVPHGIMRPCDSFSMTNRGLQIELFLSQISEHDQVWKGYLACAFGNDARQVPYIYLRCLFRDLTHTTLFPQYQRIRPHILSIGDPETSAEGRHQKIHLVKNVQLDMQHLWQVSNPVSFFFVLNELAHHVVDWYPILLWDPQMKLFRPERRTGTLGVFLVKERNYDLRFFLVLKKMSASQRPYCGFFYYYDDYNLEDIYFDKLPAAGEVTAEIINHPTVLKYRYATDIKNIRRNGQNGYEIILKWICDRG